MGCKKTRFDVVREPSPSLSKGWHDEQKEDRQECK